jgi:amidohydrolase
MWTQPLQPHEIERLNRWRRHLHSEPELSLVEVDTQAYLRGELESIGITAISVGHTGLMAALGPADAERVLLVRADMDALPIEEQTGLPFASKRRGCMHACGHDTHMACLLAVAARLKAAEGELPLRVVLCFQPGEEDGRGAVKMIEAGALDGRWCNDPGLKVQAALGLHIWSPLPTGVVSACPGPVMATVDDFRTTVRGRGGHGALPHQAVDAIVAAAGVVQALQTLASRRIDPLDPVVVSIGSIHGGTTYNVIAEEVHMHGTVRSYSPELAARLPSLLPEVAHLAAQAYGASAETIYSRYTIALHNDPALAQMVAEVAEQTPGVAGVDRSMRMMAGEDFAYIAAEVPACFFFVGCGGPEAAPHHSPRFVVDEKALPVAAEVMLRSIAAWAR